MTDEQTQRQHDGHGHGHGHGHVHSHSPGGGAEGTGELSDLLDLDGAVLHDYWHAALDLVTATARGVAEPHDGPDLVVDLGAGTGTGALGLARRWPEADVVALDVEAEPLARISRKATDAGLPCRVRTVAADLDTGWPAELSPVDVTFASMSVHHLADPSRSLRQLRAQTREGGVVALAEFDEPLRFLPDDLGVGEPGFETRVMEVMGRAHEESVPAIGSPWARLLTEAGWTVLVQEDLRIDDRAPRHPLAGRYARAWYERLSEGVGDRLSADDRATLAALLDDDGPHALLTRGDLHLHGVRTVTVARA
jgi:SAM-dependent methyltransferase